MSGSPYVATETKGLATGYIPESERIKALELQNQELRQILIWLLNPYSGLAIASRHAANYYYDRLSAYPRIEE